MSSKVQRLRASKLVGAASARIRRSRPRAPYSPPNGLSVPIVTMLDRAGKIVEPEQRAIIRYALQDGSGANVIFATGTTGEWNRLDNRRMQQVARLAVEECRRVSDEVETWIGITAHNCADTIANLEHAIELSSDAAVVAPLAIADADNPVDFVEREIGEVFERRGRSLPIYLYDNADIASSERRPHLHTRDIKRLSQLPYIHGIKVTASKAVLGNYTRAAAQFRRRGQFAIYPGNAYLIFDLFRPANGVAGRARGYWNRYLTRNSLPEGIVVGAANVMPREWQRSWQICRRHQVNLMTRYGGVLEQFRAACEFNRDGRPAQLTIACLKTALKELGVCTIDTVARGTPELDGNERREFLRRFRALRRVAATTLEPEWTSSSEAWSNTPDRDCAGA